METTERIHWILLATSEGLGLFTDLQNLIFLLDPLAGDPDLSQTSLREVLRWLQSFLRSNIRAFTSKASITSGLTIFVAGLHPPPFVVWFKYRLCFRRKRLIFNGLTRISFRLHSRRTVHLVYLIWNSTMGSVGNPTILYGFPTIVLIYSSYFV